MHPVNKMKVLSWIKQEIVHVLPVFLFFLLFFTLINWIETLLFKGTGVRSFHFLEIAFAAALIAKIILVIDHLPWIHRFRKHPLAYGILWKTLFYWIFLFWVRLFIRFVSFLFNGENLFQLDVSRFIHQVSWNVFFSIQAYYLMLLFIFITFQELTYKIGAEKMRKLFFGK